MLFKVNQLQYFITSEEYNLSDRNLMKGYLFNETKQIRLMGLFDVFFPRNINIFHTIDDTIRGGDKILIKTDEPNKEDFEKALTNSLKPEKIDEPQKKEDEEE
jgi:hypothetical protein